MTFQTLMIDCLRHGACEGPQECLRGHTDVALSAQGHERMLAAAKRLARPHAILCSPLIRCKRVGELLAQDWNVPLHVVPEIMEMNFGDWDGVATQDLLQHARPALENFWRDPQAFPPPGGESLDDFLTRIDQGWQHLLVKGMTLADKEQQQKETGPVRLLVCGHAGVIKSWMAMRLGMPLTQGSYLHRLHLPYAGVARLRVDIDRQSGEQFEQLYALGS
ncbi:histidine phosphatase family protein [Kushneria phyllosphaerae]|uniref:Adenosylcobalamin/alpha-ribazole phosphatase n=1 Tax=Kushneria phyllosphaerae TaxID=2100822 RepID=A0A2R8CP58_9GAMM|nr:histidine phosphatase family protein [Kushneria phyllosphaerae]SPJ34698.1 Adenosylcobalamin/alpha-ribazole phosphatase [Kushneria phyllosphaerae]